MGSNQRLAARVKAVNLANEVAREFRPKLVEALTPLVGTKVIKQDGSIMESVKKKLPEFPRTHAVSIYRCQYEYAPTYTVEGITELRRQWKEADELARQARSALSPFGEYDR